MRIEIPVVNNSGDSELGNIIIRTYSHIIMYSQYDTAPKIFEQSRVGLGTATPDARLHVTAGVSSVYGNEGVSTWLGYIGMMNSAALVNVIGVILLVNCVLYLILMFGIKLGVWLILILELKKKLKILMMYQH
jgi:hypothetical protein